MVLTFNWEKRLQGKLFPNEQMLAMLMLIWLKNF